MSETKENYDDCGHLYLVHFDEGCKRIVVDDCFPCTRTYESLVGERFYTCGGREGQMPQAASGNYGPLGVSMPILVGEKAKLAELNTNPKWCPCKQWETGMDTSIHPDGHHTNCDGYGNRHAPPEPAKYAPAMKEHKIFTPQETILMTFTNPTAVGVGEPELSLLIIDLGNNQCVVKAERFTPSLPSGDWWLGVGGEAHDAHSFQFKEAGTVHLVDYPFADVRSAIDGEKPLPRLEQDNADNKGSYVLYEDSDTQEYLAKPTYDALSKLAGHPLPIWTGGTWTRLIEKGPLPFRNGQTSPCDIWQYTIGGE